MHKFEDYVLHPAIQTLLITLVIISGLTYSIPAHAQDISLTELQTRALVLNKQGKYLEAVKVAEEALKTTEEEFGSDHTKTAASMSILGLLYFSLLLFPWFFF